MKSTGAGFPAAAAESITQSLSEICAAGEDYPWDPPRRFSGYANRLHLLLTQLLRSSPPQDLFAPAVHTAFRGIAADLSKAAETVGVYRSKSRIYVLINCTTLCSSLHDRTISIGGWLALLLDSPLPLSNPGLHKKAADLSRDMQQANLRVTENEERVYRMLKKEGEARQTSKAVQSGIIMDLARALGMGPTDHDRLAEQIRLLKLDLAGSSSVTERRILISLEKIFDSWSAEPHVGSWCSEAGFEEEAHIPLFKNFLCPLTKEVMKDPVALESLQTYERTAIRYWFDRCIEDGRDPTCPVTGQVLKTLELKPNIGLAGAIEEWVNRNIETQINSAVQYLCDSCSSPLECVERALDNVYRILEEYPSSKYRVRNAGIVGLVVKLLKDQCNSIASHVRGKALMALHSMARDEESKLKMMDEGITRLAIRSLTGSLETEREYAVKLLLGFSCDEGYCAKLASEKGAVVLLSSMAGSSENPTLSNLAEELLRNMEKVEENVQHLAVAGRFQPLLTRLCEGTEDTRIEIACLVGQMTLANNGKEHIARQGGKVLVAMLSSNLEGRTSSLQALYNLSTWDDNATILVDYGVLPALTNILFTQEPNDPYYVMELATSTMANMVSKSGHWELSAADKDGHSMQSDFIIHRLLELISLASSKCQVAILQILYGITSSPQASELAATHIRSCNGVGTITTFLEHPEIDHRIYAFRLANLLSERLGQDLADELRASNKLSLLVHKLMDTECSVGERSEVAGILANLPFSAEEVRTVLGTDLLKWAVSNLKEQRSRTSGRHSRHYTSLVEGLLGLLLHYARTLDPTILRVVRENQLMTVFQEQLTVRSQAREKQRAVLGLKYLSESAKSPMVSGDLEPQPPRGFCAPLVLMCGRAPMIPVLCPLHSAACEEDSSFCLLKGNAVKPLIDLMNDENTGVQIAAVEALSTLVLDVQSLKVATKELEQLGLIDATIDLFKGVRPGELQERVIWMVDKFFQVDSLVQVYSVDQGLVRALVEALKHGNTNTKRHARDALTYLRELSGVGGKNPNQSHGRRVIS